MNIEFKVYVYNVCAQCKQTILLKIIWFFIVVETKIINTFERGKKDS